MRIGEYLDRATEPFVSYEIIPPKRGGDLRGLISVVEDVLEYRPPFIDITSHPAETVYRETETGIKKRVTRRRPGTLGLCALIQNKYGVEAVPHVLCRNFTREETEDFLIELNYVGVQNVLAVQGDDMGFEKQPAEGRTVNKYAVDLVRQIADLNNGTYIGDELLDAKPSNFCVGVGGYPEKHFEAPNLATDMKRAKEKVDAGASYIVTQMFFDNEAFYRYRDGMRELGVTVPIIPGLKILTTKGHLAALPKHFSVNIPEELAEEASAAKKERVIDVGAEWAAKQARDLLDNGVPGVHFYIMQKSRAIKKTMELMKWK
jgi:methylenetetrahydrofolate reductase (NADPH)